MWSAVSRWVLRGSVLHGMPMWKWRCLRSCDRTMHVYDGLSGHILCYDVPVRYVFSYMPITYSATPYPSIMRYRPKLSLQMMITCFNAAHTLLVVKQLIKVWVTTTRAAPTRTGFLQAKIVSFRSFSYGQSDTILLNLSPQAARRRLRRILNMSNKLYDRYDIHHFHIIIRSFRSRLPRHVSLSKWRHLSSRDRWMSVLTRMEWRPLPRCMPGRLLRYQLHARVRMSEWCHLWLPNWSVCVHGGMARGDV